LKKITLTITCIVLVILAITIAGCSSTKTSGNSQVATGNSGSGVATAAPTAAAAAAAACPAVTAATSWTGTWASWSNDDVCYDGRAYFYPSTADNPDPWDYGVGGSEDFPVKFTQTGCDVTGSITVGQNGTAVAPSGCPISLTGKVDSTGAVSGTWKAYCNIQFSGTEKTLDSGVFSLNMEPGGAGFAGRFEGGDPVLTSYRTDSCRSANSNWVGKRA
jgi:hypothetical protein